MMHFFAQLTTVLVVGGLRTDTESGIIPMVVILHRLVLATICIAIGWTMELCACIEEMTYWLRLLENMCVQFQTGRDI